MTGAPYRRLSARLRTTRTFSPANASTPGAAAEPHREQRIPDAHGAYRVPSGAVRHEQRPLGQPGLRRLLKSALEATAHQFERDLEHSERENNYVTDGTAEVLKAAVRDLGALRRLRRLSGAFRGRRRLREENAGGVGEIPDQLGAWNRADIGMAESITERFNRNYGW